MHGCVLLSHESKKKSATRLENYRPRDTRQVFNITQSDPSIMSERKYGFPYETPYQQKCRERGITPEEPRQTMPTAHFAPAPGEEGDLVACSDFGCGEGEHTDAMRLSEAQLKNLMSMKVDMTGK
jgi:hypothetical protein